MPYLKFTTTAGVVAELSGNKVDDFKNGMGMRRWDAAMIMHGDHMMIDDECACSCDGHVTMMLMLMFIFIWMD